MSGGDPGWRNAFEAWTKDPGANQSRCAEQQQTVSESRRTEEKIYSQRGERLSSFPFEHGKTAPFVGSERSDSDLLVPYVPRKDHPEDGESGFMGAEL